MREPITAWRELCAPVCVCVCTDDAATFVPPSSTLTGTSAKALQIQPLIPCEFVHSQVLICP